MLSEQLETRWMVLCKTLGGNIKVALSTFDEILAAYDAPTRHYHSLSHIHACLHVMDQYVPKDEWTNHVEMALWFHDIVYVPGRSDCEDQSMEIMHSRGRKMGMNELFIGQVADMIPYTKHNAKITTGLGDRYLHLLDVDLSILGAPEHVFDKYEKDVRLEYAVVPEDLFNAGRAKILHEFLARVMIFQTKKFQDVFEMKARDNLRRSIAKLT